MKTKTYTLIPIIIIVFFVVGISVWVNSKIDSQKIMDKKIMYEAMDKEYQACLARCEPPDIDIIITGRVEARHRTECKERCGKTIPY